MRCLFCGKVCKKGTEWYDDGYCSGECKRANECRNCGAKRKDGVEWYDDDYCSGKCKKEDGGKIEPASVRDKNAGKVASLADYLLDYPKNLGQRDKHNQRVKGRMPKLYRRRNEPERLNWGEPLSAPDLKQAGLRANRRPIPGDFDYDEGDDNE